MLSRKLGAMHGRPAMSHADDVGPLLAWHGGLVPEFVRQKD